MAEITIRKADELTEEISVFTDVQFSQYAIKNGVDLNFEDFIYVAEEDGKLAGVITGRAYFNDALSRLTEAFAREPKTHPRVCVLYFIPDERKSGGRYSEKQGHLRTIDTYHRQLVFCDGETIPIDCTYRITF